MSTLQVLGFSLPLWAAVSAAALVLLGAGLLAWALAARSLFKRRLLALYRHPEKEREFRERYPGGTQARRSRLIEKIARREGEGIVALTGADEVWVESLRRRRGRREFQRVLEFAPDKGLFRCFLIAMERKALAPLLVSWLEATGGQLYMRRMARAGVGEPFDGRQALEVFRDKLAEIREMTGDPEWPSRYFAAKLLVHDGDERSVRALWDCFQDPHPLVRKTAAVEFRPGERDRLREQLIDLYLSDPSLEVRRAAHERIHRDFPEGHALEIDKLEEDQALHVLEQLDTSSKEDQDLALRKMEADNPELRRAAAEYLERCGRLRELCLEVDFNDRERLERNEKLLRTAAEVNVTSFLETLRDGARPASLLVCARILAKHGDRALIGQLARRVFPQFSGQPEQREVYAAAAAAAAARGGEDVLQLLGRELVRFKNDREMMELLLPLVPERGDVVLTELLLALLQEPGFPVPDALRAALKRLVSPVVLERALAIVRSERQAFPHAVRIQALKLLGELEYPYCLQTVLENLFVLPVEQAKDFAHVLAGYPAKTFAQKVEALLASPDAKVRAALIAALSATGDKEFLKAIRAGLKDADPDVRVAAVWALVEFEDFRSLNQAAGLLRDPVDRVRTSVARAFGAFGSAEALKQLRELLLDENEVESVKKAAIEGLGNSGAERAVDILVEKLQAEEESLQDDLVSALAENATGRKIARLVENFKDASPALRERIAEVFVTMREQGEPAVHELLGEDIASLEPYIGEILDSTGYVEDRIRRLSHRDPHERREAAEFLSLLGTAPAFRGLVLAARDPDEQVRVQVVKALEKLETKEGKEILASLNEDPDPRVRKYTQWALERLRAKAL